MSATIDASIILSFLNTNTIAYFCAEYSLAEKLPFFAGGLGVLAGDFLMEMSDQREKACIAVGLLYRKGYMSQQISKEANVYSEDKLNIEDTNLKLLISNGEPIRVSLDISGRTVKVQAYVTFVGHVPLLLLDTNLEENDAESQLITDRLYGGNREHRFEQEMVLGLGGALMLQKLGIVPAIYHLNEGHSALLIFEIAFQQWQRNKKQSYFESLESLKNVVFTNHTLVASGNDMFSTSLVYSHLSNYATQKSIDPQRLISYGLVEDASLFSLTLLALRLATVSQAVSIYHSKRALSVWPNYPMIPITNGVNQKYWQAGNIVTAKDDETLWDAHLQNKQVLCDYIAKQVGVTWKKDELVIAWTRRIAGYKRPMILFDDVKQLTAIIRSQNFPVRLLISGKPHYGDDEGQEFLRKILDLVGKSDGYIVYLQNYDRDLARLILAGVDVLVNSPVRGFEACGTSGMKSGLNGVLSCATLDGWVNEVDWSGIGWVLESDHFSNDFYKILEHEIMPLYYLKDSNGVPFHWVQRMKNMIKLTSEKFTTKRMVNELVEKVYSQLGGV